MSKFLKEMNFVLKESEKYIRKDNADLNEFKAKEESPEPALGTPN